MHYNVNMERNCLVFSDVHGDRDTMKRIREAERYFCSERIISIGDLCPDPYDILFHSIEGVRGNSDRFYEYGSLPFPPLTLSTEIYSRSVFITHGHAEVEIPEGTEVLITGHTHVPSIRKNGNLYMLNPGSASLPRSSSGPTFALFTPDGLSVFSLSDFRKIMSLNFSSS